MTAAYYDVRDELAKRIAGMTADELVRFLGTLAIATGLAFITKRYWMRPPVEAAEIGSALATMGSLILAVGTLVRL